MTQPKVTLTQLDGALGILPPSAGKLLALVGPCSAGAVDTPMTFGKVSALVSALGDGPLVEAAARAIQLHGKPVICVRTATTTAGASSAVTFTGTGTSVVTADVDPLAPYDDYEVRLLVVAGGTIGAAGITFRYSLDGGRNYSPLVSLGTAVTYTIPRSGVVLNFAAGTLVAGDLASLVTTAPKWSTGEMTAALTALRNSGVSYGVIEIVGPIGASDFDAIDTAVSGFPSVGKYKGWVGNTRIPNDGESESTYLSSLTTAFASKATTYGELCAGACKMISSVSGRKYRRPISFAVGALEAAESEEVNIADINLGALTGVSIADDNGNPDEHDESINPGLDDVRFTTLRTHDGIAGVYVNRPRCFSAEGSDFYLFPHRKVMNVGLEALRLYFLRRLNKPIHVNKTTGFILEAEALEIEAGATAALRSALMAKPKASGVTFVLSRTDNVLSTRTLTGDARIIPVAYPEEISVSVGFLNPALIAQAT